MMGWLDWYAPGAISHVTFLYFLSALAQSAAAFAALTAVFAVFRLQTSYNLLRDRFSEARSFLGGWNPPQGFVYSDAQVKNELGNAKDTRQSRAVELLTEIERWEGLNEQLPNALRLSLKWWGYLFLFSLLGLVVSEFLTTASVPLATAYCLGAVGSLWKTKRFIQDCLQSPRRTNPPSTTS